MSLKQDAHAKRVRRSRRKILEMGVVYLSIHRTSQHIYAQVFDKFGTKVLAAASSLEKSFQEKKIENGKIGKATAVGKLLAERAKAKGITKAAFDRSGYKFHGRVRALAMGAHENGLQCC